jgi:hypothetical protein
MAHYLEKKWTNNTMLTKQCTNLYILTAPTDFYENFIMERGVSIIDPI